MTPAARLARPPATLGRPPAPPASPGPRRAYPCAPRATRGRPTGDGGRAVNLLQTMADANLFGRYFVGATWDGWRAILRAAGATPGEILAAAALLQYDREPL
jgi:hypothetical protein